MEGPQGDAVDVLGWYNFQYEGGEFPVCFRPGGKFFCAEYQAPATWASQGDSVLIDWKDCASPPSFRLSQASDAAAAQTASTR